jgi:CO/xanthine dehydrogenase FAD-binding subunit
MRLARPTCLVDILRLDELAGVRTQHGVVVIGATTRQADVEHDPLIATKVPLLARVMPFIGHKATRTRGTIGGSIAAGDPAAEIPLIAVTLGAEIAMRGRDGEHRVAAADFFLGPMLTAIPPGGCVTAILIPEIKGRGGTGFHEVSARRSDFAFVSAAAQVILDDEGTCESCRVGIGGIDRPTALSAVSEALRGSRLGNAEIAQAVGVAVGGLEASSDLVASAGYRRRVAGVLARRALVDAREEAARR